MPREAFNLPLQEYLALRLKLFLQAVRACGMPVDEDAAKDYYPLWEREYLSFKQQVAA